MKSRAVLLSALLLAAVVAMAAWLLVFRAVPHAGGPLRHEVYVWQRAWTGPVRSAVAQHATNVSALCVLKAEVSWKDRKPQVARVALDYATIAAVVAGNNPQRGTADLQGGPDARQRVPAVGLALRIGAYAGPFTAPPELRGNDGAQEVTRPTNPLSEGDAITLFLAELAASLVAEARSNHVNLSELQIDFDCAESKLDGYRVWLTAIQRRVAPLPVTITVLPSWLDARAFKRLAAIATNYVLQVHSLTRPTEIRALPHWAGLCDPRAALRAVERAGRIGVPFRVALPTYGYVMAFDGRGRYIGLSAEGPRPNWPEGAQLREVGSDPTAMAALVQGWAVRRPEAMRGVIWYRLPVVADNLNWRWPTLGAIVASRPLGEKLRCVTQRVESGLVEITLANEGELDVYSRLAVEVRWTNARLVAGDAPGGFDLVKRGASAVRLQTKSNSIRLRAGDLVKLGRLRFDCDCEVQCAIIRL
jgi:hypothetical protein